MHELSWRTVSVLTRVLFWTLFPSLLCNAGNKHQNNPLVSAETVRHSSTYILYISTAHLRYCTLTLTHRYTLSQYLVHFTIFFNLEFHLWVYMMYLIVFPLRLTLAYLPRIPYVIIRGTIPQVVLQKLLWKHALITHAFVPTSICYSVAWFVWRKQPPYVSWRQLYFGNIHIDEGTLEGYLH